MVLDKSGEGKAAGSNRCCCRPPAAWLAMPEEIEMVVKEGDHVLYSKYGAMEVKYDGEEYLIMRQNDILAIIKD